MNPHTLPAALRAAGAAVLGTDLVIGGAADAAFCAVRPPGHHAERARAMGFCFFNNVAVGMAHALEAHGLSRVAVVDFDVHHGNGTEDIFREDARVLMVSIFEHPFYPGSGVEGRSERMVNVPLSAGAGSREFREAVEQQWLPALERFRPQMLFISAGFDSHRDDVMAFLRLLEPDYARVTSLVRPVAAKYAGGRTVSLPAGGYDPAVLGRSVAAQPAPLPGTDIRRRRGGPGARKELSPAPPDFAGKARALTRTGLRSSLRPGAQMEVLGDRYRVERELGHGGMGRVFVAHDLKLDRDVALKVLSSGEHDAHDVLRFEQEARAAGALEHPNVVAVHDVGTHGGAPFI